MVTATTLCNRCGNAAENGAQFCTACGNSLLTSLCAGCGNSFGDGANFCTTCGTPRASLKQGGEANVAEYLIVAIRLLTIHAHPERILEACTTCLQRHPSPSLAALASVLSMSCYARLENFSEAEASLVRAREFYALHMNLSDEQRARFVDTGLFIEDLEAAGCRELRENPWLYFILGHAYGPSRASGLRGETEYERRKTALQVWGEFFDDRVPVTTALAYLLASTGQDFLAAEQLERLILIARKYDAVSPVRVEFVWPYAMSGECYWASKQEERAVRAWRRASSVTICVAIDPNLDDWSQWAFPWIEKAKSRLAEHCVPVPVWEVSRRASQHLQQAMDYILQAEEYEARDVELEELCALIRQAGRAYTAPIKLAESELDLVENLDRFTWARSSSKDSCYWYRFESAKGFLLQKIALVHLANDKLALAIASYKQAMEFWPTLSASAVMGGLQAACGLTTDARVTYQTCVERSDELGAVESYDNREEMVRGLRIALSELG